MSCSVCSTDMEGSGRTAVRLGQRGGHVADADQRARSRRRRPALLRRRTWLPSACQCAAAQEPSHVQTRLWACMRVPRAALSDASTRLWSATKHNMHQLLDTVVLSCCCYPGWDWHYMLSSCGAAQAGSRCHKGPRAWPVGRGRAGREQQLVQRARARLQRAAHVPAARRHLAHALGS